MIGGGKATGIGEEQSEDGCHVKDEGELHQTRSLPVSSRLSHVCVVTATVRTWSAGEQKATPLKHRKNIIKFIKDIIIKPTHYEMDINIIYIYSLRNPCKNKH